jgi:hypothetical protein
MSGPSEELEARVQYLEGALDLPSYAATETRLAAVEDEANFALGHTHGVRSALTATEAKLDALKSLVDDLGDATLKTTEGAKVLGQAVAGLIELVQAVSEHMLELEAKVAVFGRHVGGAR